jgi:ABC-2 type transport system permease protein
MAGPARALNTIGGQVTWQATAFGAVVAGLMSMFIVGRHIRAEEESGRDELIRASVVHRLAPTTAAALTALVANVVLGLLVAVSLAAYPLAVADSVALGVGVALCGWVFTGTALVAAQLTSSTRSMYGLAGLVIGVSYTVRAIGDVGNPALSWASPIGWYQAMHPFSGLRWWPALLLVLAAGAAVLVAFAVFARRDAGSGVLAARPGPARAGALLGSSAGLAWRLQRGAVLGWSAGLFLTGIAYGSIGDDVGDLVGDSELSQEMFLQGADDLVDGYFATSLLMLGLTACGFAISSALRARGEEESGRVEPLLATGLSRRRWLIGQSGVTVAGTVAVLTAAGLGLGVGNLLVTGDAGAFGRLSLPVLAYAGPVLVLASLALLLACVSPRLGVVAWLPLVLAVVVMLFGDVFRLPAWTQQLSPFEHLALVPVEPFRLAPVLVLLAVATAAWVAAQAAFLRRDVR